MGEEQLGCGSEGEEVSLWHEGQRRGRGYHVSCMEGGVGLLYHLPSWTGLEREELWTEINTEMNTMIKTGDHLTCDTSDQCSSEYKNQYASSLVINAATHLLLFLVCL